MPLSHPGHETLCVRVWGPEADVRSFLLLLSTLCFETESPTNPSTRGLTRLVGQEAQDPQPFLFPELQLGLLACTSVPGFWGFRLKPSP